MTIIGNRSDEFFNCRRSFSILKSIVSLCGLAHKAYMGDGSVQSGIGPNIVNFAQRAHWLILENMVTFALRILVFMGCVLSSMDGHADGDDFFEIIDVPMDHQLIFVGTVKDEDGNYMKGTLVRWKATGTVGVEGEEHTSTAGTWTNMLGRFRTVDIARIVSREGAKLDPQRVEFTVEKSGYEMVSRLIRTRGRERMGIQEIDFVMQKSEPIQVPQE
jgi:hypothetical protein